MQKTELRLMSEQFLERQQLHDKRIVANEDNITRLTIRKCVFTRCDFIDIVFDDSNLAQCRFIECTFEGCRLRGLATTLEESHFNDCTFSSVVFDESCNLAHVTFSECKFQRSSFYYCKSTPRFRALTIDTGTRIAGLTFDRNSNDIASYRYLLRNSRITRWQEWYATHRVQQWPTKAFWLLSDYGTSTTRLACSVLVVILVFQQLYISPTYFNARPLLVSTVTPSHELVESSTDFAFMHMQIRSLYFSTVTSMTVGFGDIVPRPSCIVAHILAILQIAITYVLLGALLSRVATVMQE